MHCTSDQYLNTDTVFHKLRRPWLSYSEDTVTACDICVRGRKAIAGYHLYLLHCRSSSTAREVEQLALSMTDKVPSICQSGLKAQTTVWRERMYSQFVVCATGSVYLAVCVASFSVNTQYIAAFRAANQWKKTIIKTSVACRKCTIYVLPFRRMPGALISCVVSSVFMSSSLLSAADALSWASEPARSRGRHDPSSPSMNGQSVFWHLRAARRMSPWMEGSNWFTSSVIMILKVHGVQTHIPSCDRVNWLMGPAACVQ